MQVYFIHIYHMLTMPKHHPLKGVRILSLCLNLPGPAALQRCRQMGARCSKVEPPAGDPMQIYEPQAYAELHEGIALLNLDLKSPSGQARLAQALARTDVLLTSFRPSALRKLGLGWAQLHRQYPQLCQVAIVGAPGAQAEVPGHDLTYQAEHDLLSGLTLPASLYADMGGALLASEAVLCAVMQRQRLGRGGFHEVALSQAAAWLAAPRRWGLTQPDGTVGGAHAGYRIYPCLDGRVVLAALEPHFARALCAAVGLAPEAAGAMQAPATHAAVAAFMASQTRQALEQLARERDLPLHTLA